MRGGESQAQPTTEVVRERAEYAERIRRTNERLALSRLFAFTGLVPITQAQHRGRPEHAVAVLLLVTLRLVSPGAGKSAG